MEAIYKDKTGTYPIIVNTISQGLQIINQIYIYINFNKSFLDLKKEYFNQIQKYNSTFIFHNNLIKKVVIDGLFDGCNKSSIDDKIKIKDFECCKPWITIRFPQLIQIQIENTKEVFIFSYDEPTIDMLKFIKKLFWWWASDQQRIEWALEQAIELAKRTPNTVDDWLAEQVKIAFDEWKKK
jgi:hypothetical protein